MTRAQPASVINCSKPTVFFFSISDFFFVGVEAFFSFFFVKILFQKEEETDYAESDSSTSGACRTFWSYFPVGSSWRFGRLDLSQDPMFFVIHRNFYQNNNRRHHYQHNSSHHHRHDLDCCDRLRQLPHERPISSFASSHPERNFDRLDQGDNQVVPSNRANADAASSMSLSSNERLPSAVLLARARLLERLRGVPVSGNRRSGRALSGNYEREYIAGDDLRLVDAGDRGSGSLAVGSPPAMLTPQTERPQSLQGTKKKPPGLSQEALDSLQPEIFGSRERILSMESSTCVPCKDYWDCTICLDNFKEGDKLTQLPCGHRFHSTCLNPWVRACGECPYCRRGILA